MNLKTRLKNMEKKVGKIWKPTGPPPPGHWSWPLARREYEDLSKWREDQAERIKVEKDPKIKKLMQMTPSMAIDPGPEEEWIRNKAIELSAYKDEAEWQESPSQKWKRSWIKGGEEFKKALVKARQREMAEQKNRGT